MRPACHGCGTRSLDLLERDMTLRWTASQLAVLEDFLRANPHDWRACSLVDPAFLQGLQWPASREELLPLLKAYQRLLGVLPPGEERRAMPLLGLGIHSALQIAGMAQAEFSSLWEAIFPGEAGLGEQVRKNAAIRRSQIALEHIKSIQSSEPHYLAARFR
jgi:hypothetical protein